MLPAEVDTLTRQFVMLSLQEHHREDELGILLPEAWVQSREDAACNHEARFSTSGRT